MAETREPISFTLPGGGPTFTVRGWAGLHRWHEEFQEAWAWVRAATQGDPANSKHFVTAWLAELRTTFENLRERNEAPQVAASHLAQRFEEAWAPFHQETEEGLRILEIKNETGANAGLFAFAVLKGRATASQFQTFDHFIGLQRLAMPSTAPANSLIGNLRRERSRLLSTLRRFVQNDEAATIAREEQFRSLLDQYVKEGLAAGRRRARRTRKILQAWRDQKDLAISDIRATEKAYKEEMRLKASVDYWRDKAKIHETAEASLLGDVQLFFILGTVIVVGMFSFVGWLLWKIDPAPTKTSLYFLASAGLATTVGLLLWGGRLLTKVYLSEQHLRQDAREREVMTTTYLALVKEQAATEDERQIILTALFRPTSDGIVKEEGGLDPSLASALAKFLAKP